MLRTLFNMLFAGLVTMAVLRGAGWLYVTYGGTAPPAPPALRPSQSPPGGWPLKWASEAHTRPMEPQTFEVLAQKLRLDVRAAPGAQLLFLGDSITDAWRGRCRRPGCDGPDGKEGPIREVFRTQFAEKGYRPLALGIPGDRTDSLLWRFEAGELTGLAPKATVLLIGTNNLGVHMGPKETAEGVAAVARDLLGRLPETRLAVMLLLPRTQVFLSRSDALLAAHRWARWDAVDRTNDMLRPLLEHLPRTTTVDCGAEFRVGLAGDVRAARMPDGLHPNGEGALAMARCLEPFLTKALGAG